MKLLLILTIVTLNTLNCSILSDGPFELDGNAISSVNDDWDVLLSGSDSSHSFSGIINESAMASIYTQGGSKDVNNINKWRHESGSVPDKDELLHAFAASYIIGNDVFLYFGSDRFSNGGDSSVGFWFFKDLVSPLDDGTFKGNHKNGDILILANYGSNSEIKLYKWENDDLVLLFANDEAECQDELPQSVCAITNNNTISSPWDYVPKDGPPGQFPENSFLEGGIILNNFFDEIDDGGIPCFSSFLVVSRSSSSINAQLKDFILNEFKLCGIDIVLECTDVEIDDTKTLLLYSYTISATNTGFGNLYDVSVTYNDDLIDFIDIFPPQQENIYNGTFTSLDQLVDPGIAVVTGYIFPDSMNEDDIISDTSDASICPVIPIVTSIETDVNCVNIIIDEIEEVFIYTYRVYVENVGFGQQTIDEANIMYNNLIEVVNIIGIVLDPVLPNNSILIDGVIITNNIIDLLELSVDTVNYKEEIDSSTSLSLMCPMITVTPNITIHKECDSFLELTDNRLCVKINVNVTICNTGDIKLKNLTISDDRGTENVSDDHNILQVELPVDLCMEFNYDYYPSINDGSVFSDTVTVNGSAILNFGDVEHSDTATCGLCF